MNKRKVADMKKYKITYWLNGNIEVVETEAEDKLQASIYFNLLFPVDDIISIEEVAENV